MQQITGRVKWQLQMPTDESPVTEKKQKTKKKTENERRI